MSNPVSTLSLPNQAVRLEIAKQYCRSIAVIDDQIFEEGNRPTVSSLFNTLREDCEENGVLCHLNHYPLRQYDPDNPEVIQQLKRAQRLIENSDAVILDWNLGHADTPEHALHLIRDLQNTTSLRFVLIYTRRKDFDEIERQLFSVVENLEKMQNSIQSHVVGEEEAVEAEPTDEETLKADEKGKADVEPASARGQLHDYRMKNNLFIFVRNKGELQADQILNTIQQAMLRSFPDHLHWAGLEMAAKTRSLLPMIISKLPVNTDGALSHQLLYQNDGELANQVSEVFVDELKFGLQENPLKSIGDGVLFTQVCSYMRDLCKDPDALRQIVTSSSTGWHQAVEQIKAKKVLGQTITSDEGKRLAVENQLGELTWEDVKLENARAAATGKSPKLFPFDPVVLGNLSRIIATYIETAFQRNSLITDYRAWASLKESVLSKIAEEKIWPGHILHRKQHDDEKPDYLLCITPACDCYRPKQGKYLFVGGTALDTDKPKKPSTPQETQSCVGNLQITWNATDLIIEKNPLANSSVADAGTSEASKHEPELGEGPRFEIIGALRPTFTERIIQRIWTYQSRVGVDTSELFRTIRGE